MNSSALDVALKAVGLVVTAVFSLYQARNILPGARSRLKADLEILRLLDQRHPQYSAIKFSIDEALQRTYGATAAGRRPQVRVYDWAMLVVGVLLSVGFSAWTVYLVRDGFSWWSLLTAFLSLGGVGYILGALDPESQMRRQRSARAGSQAGP